MLSIFPEELHAMEVFKIGCAGYLNKESAGDQVTAAIRKVVQGGKYVSATLPRLRLFSEVGNTADGRHFAGQGRVIDKRAAIIW